MAKNIVKNDTELMQDRIYACPTSVEKLKRRARAMSF